VLHRAAGRGKCKSVSAQSSCWCRRYIRLSSRRSTCLVTTNPLVSAHRGNTTHFCIVFNHMQRKRRLFIGSKSAISLQRGPVDPNFQVEWVAPTNHSFSEKTRLNDLSYGQIFLPFCHSSRV